MRRTLQSAAAIDLVRVSLVSAAEPVIWSDKMWAAWEADSRLNINADGSLVTAPSTSPENAHVDAESRKKPRITAGSTCRIRTPEPREVRVRVNNELRTVRAEKLSSTPFSPSKL